MQIKAFGGVMGLLGKMGVQRGAMVKIKGLAV